MKMQFVDLVLKLSGNFPLPKHNVNCFLQKNFKCNLVKKIFRMKKLFKTYMYLTSQITIFTSSFINCKRAFLMKKILQMMKFYRNKHEIFG